MSLLQDKIYPHLPVFAQNVGISAFGYQWYKRRFGGIYQQEYLACKQREDYTATQWNDYQTIQLRKLLLHAYTTVPYYRETFLAAGFNQTRLRHFEPNQLNQLPLLRKEILRTEGKTTLLSNSPEAGGAFFTTSGSSGTPASILFSHAMHQRSAAMYEARVRNWAGVSRHDARGMIGGRRVVPEAVTKPPYYRYNYVEKQLYFSAYHISRQNAASYAAGMQRYGTQYMVGYAMSNYLLARFLQEEGIHPLQMKAVLTSSEKLTPAMRLTMEQVYGCKVYDGWSGVENCGLISENEYGELLISPDSGCIEILKTDGTPAQPGEEGEVVCTGLINFDQPLVRYTMGDVVKLSPDQTTRCGRAFIKVDEITGRVEDVVVAADGRQMVRFHSVFVNLPNVIKAQVVQEEVDRFTLNIMTAGLAADERSLIRQRMVSQLGPIALHINEVDHIPAGNNGKFKAVISRVKATT